MNTREAQAAARGWGEGGGGRRSFLVNLVARLVRFG
jgi:hypothetical protein